MKPEQREGFMAWERAAGAAGDLHVSEANVLGSSGQQGRTLRWLAAGAAPERVETIDPPGGEGA